MRKVRELVVRIASENSTWGYRRIQGVLKTLGFEVCHATVHNVLKKNGFDPSPNRKQLSNWQTFVRSHLDVLGGYRLLFSPRMDAARTCPVFGSLRHGRRNTQSPDHPNRTSVGWFRYGEHRQKSDGLRDGILPKHLVPDHGQGSALY
jgi:hypothetical protein